MKELRALLSDRRRSQRGSVLSGVLIMVAFLAIISGALMTELSTNFVYRAPPSFNGRDFTKYASYSRAYFQTSSPAQWHNANPSTRRYGVLSGRVERRMDRGQVHPQDGIYTGAYAATATLREERVTFAQADAPR